MIQDWTFIEEESKRYKMIKNQRIARFIVKFTLVLVWSSCVFYTLRKLLLNYLSRSNEILDDKLLFLSSKFFFDIQRSPIYEIIWLGQVISTILSVCIYISYDAFFIILVFHLCAQLSILKLNIRNLVSLSRKETFTEMLETIVERHLQLKR